MRTLRGPRRLLAAALVGALAGAGAGAGTGTVPAAAQEPTPLPADPPDRPAGHAFSWSHELNQNEHPRWDPDGRLPAIAPRPWFRTIDGILTTAGQNGLWFSGVSALPFPPLPLHPREPDGWRTHRRFTDQHRANGLSWDVNVEVWAARNALEEGALVNNPRTEAHARRVSLIHPAYRRAAFREIKRLVPRYRGRPYVNYYTGSDEPIVFLPSGRRAVASDYARDLRRDVRRAYGWAPPRWNARPTRGVEEGLRWLAYSRYVSDRFFDMKAHQARLIRRFDPDAVISPNSYAFIEGFMPWDYTRLNRFADVVEGDPYVSFAERARPGRGRYNPGFAAKLLHDLTGKPVRVIVQAFPYSRYRPRPGDLWTWSAQALRAGATDVSFFSSQNPRFTDRRLYDAQLDIARSLRGSRLPQRPVDPSQLVVYAMASEGQARPWRRGGSRYRTGGDELYTTYALLGELSGAAFRFDADTRLVREPRRLAAARTLWLPRADTLQPAFAQALLAWTRAGGTLVVTDPQAFERAPDGERLREVEGALIGAPLTGRRRDRFLTVGAGTLGRGLPAQELTVPVEPGNARAFGRVPDGASVVARFPDGAAAIIARPVGEGRVIAFASEVMSPASLDAPGGLDELVAAIHASGGGTLDHPAWDYRIPGDPDPERPPWRGALGE